MDHLVEYCPAKVNLSLLLTGRRPDGYHLLDSLVVFADIGDTLTIEKTGQTAFHCTGSFAHYIPADLSDNSIGKVHRLLEEYTGRVLPVAFTLHKELPVGAGIGGGSTNAAAALRGLNALYDLGLQHMELLKLALRIGADVPVCLHPKAQRMQGIGEQLTPVSMPSMPAVLVNPGLAVATKDVFQAVQLPMHTPLPDMYWQDPGRHLQLGRNDLLAAALQICPAINTVLNSLLETNAAFHTLSGSGATCVGIYASKAEAIQAAATIAAAYPQWWVRCGNVA